MVQVIGKGDIICKRQKIVKALAYGEKSEHFCFYGARFVVGKGDL